MIKSMNKFTALRNLLLVAWFIHLTSFGVLAQIGIGLPAGEEPQSALDVRFDSAVSPGFLMPRVTSLPTGDIAEGMLIYYCSGCTDTDGDGQVNYENGSYYVYVDNDGNGTSEWTELASNAGVVEVDNTSPTAPTNLAASNPSTTTIDLSWTVSTDNVGVAGYFIYLNDGTLVTTAPSNSITVTGLEANTSYTFYVTAYDASMNESTSSETASETTSEIGCEALPVCSTSFEEDWGCWTTLYEIGGGASVSRVIGSAQNGVIMVQARKNAGIGTSSTDLSSYGSLDINFWYRTSGYGGSDKVIIQYSSNGSDWTTLNESSRNNSSSWAEVNYSTSNPSVMSSSTYIRIIGTGSSGNDYAYIDNTTITANCP